MCRANAKHCGDALGSLLNSARIGQPGPSLFFCFFYCCLHVAGRTIFFVCFVSRFPANQVLFLFVFACSSSSGWEDVFSLSFLTFFRVASGAFSSPLLPQWRGLFFFVLCSCLRFCACFVCWVDDTVFSLSRASLPSGCSSPSPSCLVGIFVYLFFCLSSVHVFVVLVLLRGSPYQPFLVLLSLLPAVDANSNERFVVLC